MRLLYAPFGKFPGKFGVATSKATRHMPIKTRIKSCVFQIKFTNLGLKLINYVKTLEVYQSFPICVKYSLIGNFLVHILVLIEKKFLSNKCDGLILPSHYLPILSQRLKAKWL